MDENPKDIRFTRAKPVNSLDVEVTSVGGANQTPRGNKRIAIVVTMVICTSTCH